MSQSGSFGVNYKKAFATTEAILPAKVGTVGSLVEGDFVFVQADGAVDQYGFVKSKPMVRLQCLQPQTLVLRLCL